MKVLLDIKDNKATLLEVLKVYQNVKATTISNEKGFIFMEEIKEAVENLTLVRQGKIKGTPAKDLLNEL